MNIAPIGWSAIGFGASRTLFTRAPQSGFSSAGQTSSSAAASAASQLALTYGLTEVHQTSQGLMLAYHKDQSLAMKAVSISDLRLRQETITLEIRLTADQVGLTAADFRNPGQPIVLNLSFQQSQAEIEHSLKATLVKPTRSAEEIVTDLAKAIATVLRDPSNKTVRYELDEEARQALLGADLKLWQELVMMIAAINLQQRAGEARRDYLIQISGKRPPYWDVVERQSLQAEQANVHIQITILPPAESNEAQATSNEP